MIAAADFLLKVIICSGLLTGFYWLLLRNKLFHQWNRYYLMASVFLSLCIPFTKITLTHTAETPAVTYQALQAVTTNENWIEDSPVEQQITNPVLTTENTLLSLYILVSLIILILFIAAILKIRHLLKTNQQWKIERLTFVETDAKGTPFSFFRFLFWNNAIDFHSQKGQQIFAHELIHVEEKHSADKLLMQLVLIVFWINPFFWLIKRELAMIHEFIADQKSVKNHDTASFAEMILASVYPTVNFPLTNSFFYSPIKRRLLMLSKLQNPKVSYFSRLLLLPLLTLIFFAFVLKTKTTKAPEPIKNLEKQVVVVIDAGHGLKNGSPEGAYLSNGLSEDEISLAITKKIEALNTDKNLKLIFTRTGKDFVGLHERADFANANKADLFVSIHANFSPMLKEGNKYVENPDNGFELYVARDEFPFVAESKRLASMIVNEMQGIITLKEPAIKQRQQGIWVLQSTNCPAVLLECGFISNKKDAEFLSNEKNQEKMAEAILRGISKYVTTAKNFTAPKDTVPSSQQTYIPKENNQPLTSVGLTTESTKEGVSQDLMNEYEAIVLKYKTSNLHWPKEMMEKIPQTEKERLQYIYLKMNKEQQSNQTIAFIKRPPPFAKTIPTKEQFESWKNAKIYGIWINNKRVSNTELNKYRNTDFSHCFVSKLYKNAINYGKHYVQVDLMTNVYYEDYLKHEAENINPYNMIAQFWFKRDSSKAN